MPNSTPNPLKSACLSLLFLSLLALHPASAQNETADKYHDKPAKQLYTEGTNLLTHGHSFEKAIAIFSELTRREPKNGEYQVLLGCAYASRAFVVSRAYGESLIYEPSVAYYQRKLKRWRDAQQDEKSPAYGIPKPPAPVFPVTQDDDQRFKLTPSEAQAQIKDLATKAQSILQSGVDLTTGDSLVTRAKMLNLQGWALLLLWNEPRRSTPDSWQLKGNDKIIQVLEEATKLQPENLSLLRSLGDGCVITAYNERHQLDRTRRFDPTLYAKGISYLQQVLTKTPNDGTLWLRVGELEVRQSAYTGDRTKLLEAVQHAVALNPSNALLWYDLAASLPLSQDKDKMVMIFHLPQDMDKVLSTLERGNIAPNLVPLQYAFATPKILGWAFPAKLCLDIRIENVVVPTIGRLSEEAVSNKDETKLFRLARITLVMAQKYRKCIDSGDLSEEGDQNACRMMTGMSIETLGKAKSVAPSDVQIDMLLQEANVLNEKYESERKIFHALEDKITRD